MKFPEHNSFNDQQLATLISSGDHSAFRLLYEQYWQKLFIVAAKRLNDEIEAEEVVQDIFLNLWRKREAFKLKIGFENYFSIAVKFEIINRRAKRVKQNTESVDAIGEVVDGDIHLRHNFDLEQLQKQLEFTINTLPPKCRLVFNLSRNEDYPNKKIAAELGLSEKTVEKHITTALKVLRMRFGKLLPVLLILF